MSVFKYFKNIPRSPSHRATGPMCNFFFQICNEVPGEKKTNHVARWGGDRGLSPTPRATGPCRPLEGGRQPPPFFSRTFIFAGTYFELFERVTYIKKKKPRHDQAAHGQQQAEFSHKQLRFNSCNKYLLCYSDKLFGNDCRIF